MREWNPALGCFGGRHLFSLESRYIAYYNMDAVLVLLGLVFLFVAVGAIMLKAWSVNKAAERQKLAEQQAV